MIHNWRSRKTLLIFTNDEQSYQIKCASLSKQKSLLKDTIKDETKLYFPFNWYFQKWQNAIFTLMDLLVQFKITMLCVFCLSMSLMKKYISWHGFCYLDYAYLQSYIMLLLQLLFWHHNWEKISLPGIWRKIEKISTGK